jgi:hypothetical protein
VGGYTRVRSLVRGTERWGLEVLVVKKVRRRKTSMCARETDTQSMWRSVLGVPCWINVPSFIVAFRARDSRTFNCIVESVQSSTEDICIVESSEAARYSALGGKFVGLARYFKQALAVC